ncbi:MAG: uncharacterized protein QOI61_2254 [Actinomycetota bacterium]
MVDVERMRADLFAARKQRDKVTEAALKRCLAALENAEAPPAQDRVNLAGGARRPTEVARLVLSEDDRVAVLAAEIAEAAIAAEQYEAGGHRDAAERLRAETAVIATYLP